MQANVPYDQFARSILTASGSNKKTPQASYYKILREPDAVLAGTTPPTLTIDESAGSPGTPPQTQSP